MSIKSELEKLQRHADALAVYDASGQISNAGEILTAALRDYLASGATITEEESDEVRRKFAALQPYSPTRRLAWKFDDMANRRKSKLLEELFDKSIEVGSLNAV
jgi:hypothetical protein